MAVSLTFCAGNKSGNATADEEMSQSPEIKVVAYLPMWKMPATPRWDKITHVNLSFGYVNADGTINMSDISSNAGVVTEAHVHGVKVLVSIGGGGSKNFTEAITDPENRATLVGQLAAWTDSLGLDGWDIDYEEWDGGPAGVGDKDIERREALEALYRELRQTLGSDKLLTAAVNASWDNGGYGVYNCFTNTMHQYLDFVSLMIYDETGPWSGTRTGPHSSMDFFEHAVNHWLANRDIPKEKLVVGVPFYGYEFSRRGSADDAKSIAYRDILALYPDQNAHMRDSIGLLYYDGMPTIKRKVETVKNDSLGGVMFWEITQDTEDPATSLLCLIDSIVKN